MNVPIEVLAEVLTKVLVEVLSEILTEVKSDDTGEARRQKFVCWLQSL